MTVLKHDFDVSQSPDSEKEKQGNGFAYHFTNEIEVINTDSIFRCLTQGNVPCNFQLKNYIYEVSSKTNANVPVLKVQVQFPNF